ncbi:MAG: ABC transporter ATP-binding protein [Lachnospiraceae bacterium]
MERPVIRVKDLYKIYRIGTNKVYALNGVDFSVSKGEFCCIVGTSGSGKSTLLNMMAGLEPPTKGEIIVAGEHIEKKNEAGLVLFRQAHVGFIFQSYNLLPNLTALENVAMPLTFQGVPKTVRLKRAMKMLSLVGLEKYVRHRPGQMSGGQQQRVGIARALVVKPEIVFADEPTGNLDSNTTMDVLNLIRKIVHEEGQTVVMVTHDNNLAAYGDKIIHIKDGKITEIEDNRKKAEENALAGLEVGGTLASASTAQRTEQSEVSIWDEIENIKADEKETTDPDEQT